MGLEDDTHTFDDVRHRPPRPWRIAALVVAWFLIAGGLAAWALVFPQTLRGYEAAGILQLKPGFEAMRHQARRGEIPPRTVWTLLLVVVVVFAAIQLLRPALLGPALAVFAGIVVLLTVIFGIIAWFVTRKRQQ